MCRAVRERQENVSPPLSVKQQISVSDLHVCPDPCLAASAAVLVLSACVREHAMLVQLPFVPFLLSLPSPMMNAIRKLEINK